MTTAHLEFGIDTFGDLPRDDDGKLLSQAAAIRATVAEAVLADHIGIDIVALGEGTGKGVLIVDDLVDTGATARVVRDMMPAAHFATVYAKPLGRPLVDTFITEVSQDTWIYFPWDLGLSFQPPMKDGAG